METIPWKALRDQATAYEYSEDENHNSHVTAAWIGGRKFEPIGTGSTFVEVSASE